jgi:DNA-binding transcriptional regulator YdaS (Cro superfamily)
MMTLNDYLRAPGSLTVSELRAAIGVKSDAQIRQWQHGYNDRTPSPENCTAIEQATGRAVMRWHLRPDDWHRIWPELIGQPGSPAVQEQASAAAEVQANA